MWGGWDFHVGKLFSQPQTSLQPQELFKCTIVIPNGTCVNYRDPCPHQRLLERSGIAIGPEWGWQTPAEENLRTKSLTIPLPTDRLFQCIRASADMTRLPALYIWCCDASDISRHLQCSEANILIIKRLRVPMRPKQQKTLIRQFKMSQSCCFFLFVIDSTFWYCRWNYLLLPRTEAQRGSWLRPYTTPRTHRNPSSRSGEKPLLIHRFLARGSMLLKLHLISSKVRCWLP